jgi:hypothetical protein
VIPDWCVLMEGSDFWTGIFWAVGSGVVLLAPVLYLIGTLRKSSERAALYEVRTLLHGIPILLSAPKARLRGLRRDWDGQWRGVGVLVLTEDGLYFRPSHRPVDLRIPLERIIAVEGNTKSAGSKSDSNRLRLHYHGVDNTVRVASWSGVDAQKWIETINALRGSSEHD